MDKTGGPAFPSRGGMMFYVPDTARDGIEKAVAALDQEHAGMTMRQHYAAAALKGLTANPALLDTLDQRGLEFMALAAVRLADLMVEHCK